MCLHCLRSFLYRPRQQVNTNNLTITEKIPKIRSKPSLSFVPEVPYSQVETNELPSLSCEWNMNETQNDLGTPNTQVILRLKYPLTLTIYVYLTFL